MVTIALRPGVADQLKTEAEQHQISLDALVNDWLEDQLWRQRHDKIHQEAEHFQARHAELLAQYAGRYIAMRDGVVLDHDADLAALHARIRARYGDAPILIAPVTPEPVQTFKVIGTRRRNVLNKLPLLLDGQEQQTDVLDDSTMKRLRARRIFSNGRGAPSRSGSPNGASTRLALTPSY